ncbi:MAG: glycosyltransferase family 9 protein [Candidatus Omnitrophica bacterium]|nr:glycosyltransferase family 9 protein [Candidatus Omnitrophota bacterium]
MKSFIEIFIGLVSKVFAVYRKLGRKPAKVFIFRPDELGDVVLWLDAAEKLREYYPRAKYRIIVMGKPDLKPLLSRCPYWDKIIDFDPKRYDTSALYRLRAICKLAGADIIINPLIGRPFAVDRLIRHSRAGKKYGLKIPWDRIQWTAEAIRTYGDEGYTDLVVVPLDEHMTRINMAFVSYLCKKEYAASPGNIDFVNDDSADYGFSFPRRYCIIVPGAGAAGRCWESFKFAELINRIHRHDPEICAVVCGTESEKSISARIMDKVEMRSRVIDECGKTGLIKLIALVRHSKLVIGNDTGTIHLASSLKIPSVCILGGGHFGIFQPYPRELVEDLDTEAVYHRVPCYNCTWSCYRAATFDRPYPCIAAISVDSVFARVEGILDKCETQKYS